jgi:hypothetical protein
VNDREKYNPGEAREIACSTCGHSESRTVQSARVAGWRVGPGVAYCPGCCGEGGVTPQGEPAGYDAECQTCHASASEDEWADEPMSKEDVEQWSRRHECEPEVSIIAPLRTKVGVAS